MIPIGVAVTFLGYAAGMWGYCLVRGYNVTAGELFAQRWPGPVKKAAAGSAAPKPPNLRAAPPVSPPNLKAR